MDNMELVIREHAYHLWKAEGCPEGRSDAFWIRAQREVLASSLSAIGRVTAAATEGDATRTAKKPTRKAKADMAAKASPKARHRAA